MRSGTCLTADGTRLAFASGGRANAPALLCANGVGVSTFFWDYIGERFSSDHHVVVWDYRGHGASGQPHSERITMAQIADDLARVMDANDITRAVLLGHSMGTQVILEFYRLFPDRVDALIPVLGAFGHLADTFLDPRVGRWVYRAAYEATHRMPSLVNFGMRASLRRPVTWQLARLTGLVHPDLAKKEDIDPYRDHLVRIDFRVFMEFVRAAQEHDAGPYLSAVDVPVLVVAGERDLFTPRHLSMEMASRMPHAELLEIPRGSHAALIEQPELINLRVEKFLRESVRPFWAERSAHAPAVPEAMPSACQKAAG